MDSDSTKKPFYRNTDDTLEDVGISRRQLGHWRKSGLFDPELGPTTKFFTQDDTEQLRFLKRLIEDLKLPVEKVKQLIASAQGEQKRRIYSQFFTFIDVENMKLMLPTEARDQLLSDAIGNMRPGSIEPWLQAAAFSLFRIWTLTRQTPAVYEARVAGLLEQLARIDLMARLVYDESEPVYDESDPKTVAPSPPFRFSPSRESDPTLTLEEAERLVVERQTLEKASGWDLHSPPF